jgi:hypothetical protein
MNNTDHPGSMTAGMGSIAAIDAIPASTRNPIRLAWEIQKARNPQNAPDLGARADLDFIAPIGSAAHEDVDRSLGLS